MEVPAKRSLEMGHLFLCALFRVVFLTPVSPSSTTLTDSTDELTATTLPASRNALRRNRLAYLLHIRSYGHGLGYIFAFGSSGISQGLFVEYSVFFRIYNSEGSCPYSTTDLSR